MDRGEEHRRVVLERRLGAVAVVDVEIDDRHALQPEAWATRAATAILENTQNPMAVPGSA
jgi:hypothetical protein